MPSCFVIQPFDGGRFDKRYADVFEPAIKAAGLDPYRVDQDPSVSIPINEIEEGIRAAAVCFAEITVDNPNVWFELGFALAARREVCMICSKERQGKFPFDVHHRNIISYGVDSSSDFGALERQITMRLKATLEKVQKLALFDTQSSLKVDHGLSQHEKIVLAAMLENCHGPGETVPHFIIKNSLEMIGQNNITINVNIEKLIRKSMISVSVEQNESGDTYKCYAVEEPGMSWLIKNYESLDPARNSKS